MSLPSDVNPDVAEAARAMDAGGRPSDLSASVFRKISREQYGFAAAALVAFVGVAICGPQVRAMRKQRQRRVIDRVSRAADRAVQQAQRRAGGLRAEAERRARQVSERLPGTR